MKKYLIKLANHLDQKGLHKEADYVDWIMKKAEEEIMPMPKDFSEASKYISMAIEEIKSGSDKDSVKKKYRIGLVKSKDFNEFSQKQSSMLTITVGASIGNPKFEVPWFRKGDERTATRDGYLLL